jgi:tetratricopeptide (TPR) repeat protein
MKYIWLVEKYLAGDMKGEELHHFELEILRNPELANEVERVRKLDSFARKQYARLRNTLELVEDYDDMQNVVDESLLRDDLESLQIRKISKNDPEFHDFRQKVKTASIRKEVRENFKNNIMISRKAILIAAASIAILLAFSLVALLTRSSYNDPALAYERFYEPYPADLLVRDLVVTTTAPYQSGLSEYQQANYGMALSYFNQIPPGSEANNAIFLLKGVCYMELKQFENALICFDTLMNDPVLSDYGKWYKGLCYIKLDEPEHARKVFSQIMEQGGHFSTQAKNILKSL